MTTLHEKIARYYDHSQFYYTHFWSRVALHYGLWYKNTRSLAEAITNTNKLVIDTLAIGANDFVLDAGCGVGGSAIYIAETTGARVEAVTLSSVQLKIARVEAARSPAAVAVNVSQQDFSQTTFPSASFTKIYGIESICYAVDKRDFLREAYRLLRPGGRLAVIDTFLTKEQLSDEENCIYRRFIGGWVVPNLPTRHSFAEALADVGFRRVAYYDLTQYIWRSVMRVFRVGVLTSAFNIVKTRLRLASENRSAFYQRAAFKRNIAVYGMFVAEKDLIG